MPSLKDQAIKYALENKWQDACTTNLQILEETPNDVDCLNRLAFSYFKLNDYEKARETYNRVISIDTTNPIAKKNLHKIDTVLGNGIAHPTITAETSSTQTFGFDNLYIEEAGKTKTVDLKNIADKKTLSRLQAGEIVNLTVKRAKIFIQSLDGNYIGMLPDNIGMRLVSLIKGGNEYQACIRSITDKAVVVFIRETKQSSKFKNQPSFISSSLQHNSKF